MGLFSWAPRILTLSLFSTVTDLQEEGKSAINSPMAPALVDIHPEDTQLGTEAPLASFGIHLWCGTPHGWVVCENQSLIQRPLGRLGLLLLPSRAVSSASRCRWLTSIENMAGNGHSSRSWLNRAGQAVQESEEDLAWILR